LGRPGKIQSGDFSIFNGKYSKFVMKGIRIGCETYTWQMPGEQYKGKLDHIMKVCEQAGFQGIEPETSFLRHLEDPILMQETLLKYNMEFAVLCVVEDWWHPKETIEERKRAEKWIRYLSHFPETMLLLVQMPGKDRKNLVERQNNLLNCVNAFSKRAKAEGIQCSYHPNSPQGSVFRTASDYEILLQGLNHDVVGYCPDVGHIAKGGMDPLEICKKYRPLINLVHYKDMYTNGRWALTGEGDIDFKSITTYLKETGYQGWIIMEDECDDAITDPDGVTLKDETFIRDFILDWIK
jgi:inosose dehydratase